MDEQVLLAPWRQLLEDRARQAVETLAQVPGLLGLILCGSIGRGEDWPLSDVDMIPIYEDGRAEAAAREVEARRLELLDWWAAEGSCTCLDVGKLAFTRAEVVSALAAVPSEAAGQLGDPRWFHSLDKAYRGRAAFDPTGLATALSQWFTAARFAPEVVDGRLAAHRRRMLEQREQAAVALGRGDTPAAAIALREGLHALTRYLMEGWGERDNSWGRFGTRFERAAAARGEGELVAGIMALYRLTPDEVARRMVLAPQGVRHRHRLSLAARRLVAEPATAAQDARDVLLVFSTRETRYRRPPFAAWVGLDTDPATLNDHLDEYSRLLARSHQAASEGSWSAGGLGIH